MAEGDRRSYRLGLDVGSNSLGWFTIWLDKDGNGVGLGPGGTRIYPDGRDPQSKTSNAVDRRMARGARRRHDRYLTRRSLLMSLLVQHGLMPEDVATRKALEGLDPYEFRAKALDETLPAHHIGRALFHLKSTSRLFVQPENREERRTSPARSSKPPGSCKNSCKPPALARSVSSFTVANAPANMSAPATAAPVRRPSTSSTRRGSFCRMSSTQSGPNRRPIIPR